MSTIDTLYSDSDTAVSDYGIDIPSWIEDDITAGDIAAILEGGCASGAYMPAVTYYTATQTMANHGDDVLQYIQDTMGELPGHDDNVSWSGIAVHYLSVAVELWASSIGDEIAEGIEESDEDEEDDDDNEDIVWEVYATNTGDWGPDECYGDCGEWHSPGGRPRFSTAEAAEAAVAELSGRIDDSYPEGIEYSYDVAEID